MTTKAVIEAALGVDVEARRLLLMEGAQAHEATSTALELDRLSDQLDDLRLASDAVNRLLTDHRFGLYPTFGRRARTFDTVCMFSATGLRL